MNTISLDDVHVKDFLRADSLKLAPGLYGVIGPNGAGKTTLMRVIAGHLPASAGTVDCATTALARTGHDIALAGWTVADHLDIARRARGALDLDYARNLLERFDLAEKSRCSKLSTGQRQILAVITALAARTPITLLDEPFNGLDAPTRSTLREILIDHAAQTSDWTLLISSHRAEDLAGLADALVILQAGIATGPVQLDEQRALFPSLTGETSAVDAAIKELDAEVLDRQTLGPTTRALVRATHAPADLPATVTVEHPDDAQLIDSIVTAAKH